MVAMEVREAFFAHPCAATLGKLRRLQRYEHTPTIRVDPNLLALVADKQTAEA
jgi:hypothetical protein